MSQFKTPVGVYFLLIVSVLSVSWCVYRDIRLIEQFPGDLRNRVVGSRMQQDGKSPYFYHWHQSDGERYYDWNNGSSAYLISNVTATPFFHSLITPIANFSQVTIARIWLLCCYVMLGAITVMAMVMCKNRKQVLMTWIVTVLFLHSYGWTKNITNGQMYLLIPFLAMLIYQAFRYPGYVVTAILLGVLSMSLLLVRSTAVLFLLPFGLVVARYPGKYKLAIFSGAALIAALAFGPSSQRFYWKDYSRAMGEHLKQHQNLRPERGDSVFVPTLATLEGWKLTDTHQAVKDFPWYIENNANGNAFVFINILLGVHIPVWLLGFLCLVAMSLLAYLYFNRYPFKGNHQLYPLAVFGFLLYMLSDIFSPIHRFQYNAGQWAFPLLLTAGLPGNSYSRLSMTGIIAGLLLNSIPWSVIPMQQTVGEYVLLASLICALLTFKPANQQ